MKKKHPFCSTCKNHHPQHDDGFEYLDCMLYVKRKDGKKVPTITTNTDNNGIYLLTLKIWTFPFVNTCLNFSSSVSKLFFVTIKNG